MDTKEQMIELDSSNEVDHSYCLFTKKHEILEVVRIYRTDGSHIMFDWNLNGNTKKTKI